MNHSIPAKFELSRESAAKAIQPEDRPVPTMDVLLDVITAMPAQNLMQRRDRAIIAATCLFGDQPQTPEDDKDLLLLLYEYQLTKGTPEFERAERLHGMQRKAWSGSDHDDEAVEWSVWGRMLPDLFWRPNEDSGHQSVGTAVFGEPSANR